MGRSVVGARDHEKQSYRIIMDYDFTELSKREKRIIAVASLFHNGHSRSFDLSRLWKLRSEEQAAAMRLAAILRIADGLDATNKQVVVRLRIDRTRFGDAAEQAVILDLNCVNNAKAEIKAVLTKKDLFEELFGRSLLIDTNRMERILAKGRNSKLKLFRED